MRKPVKTIPMVNKLLVLILAFFLTQQSYLFGQCAQTLRTARTAYDEGQLQSIPGILESCMNASGDSGFTDDEKTEAYRILILTYIFTDEPDKADEAMLALLRFNPQFEISPDSDPAELINLYGTFRTHPIFYYGIKGGLNLTQIDVQNTFSVLNPENSQGEYEKNPGFQIGASVEIPLTKDLILNPEVYFTGNFNTYVNNFAHIDSVNRFIRKHEFKISHISLVLPVTVQYRVLKNSRLNPYIFAGGSVSYLLTATLNGQTNTSNESFEGPSEDLIEQRVRLNFNATIGSGVKIKAGKNTFTAEIRVNYGILNLVDEDNRFKNQDLIFDYGYVENDFKLHSLSLSVGYLLPKYNPKKLGK